MEQRKKMLLFDVDGTLTPPRQAISKETRKLLEMLKQKYIIGVVGGSDESKIREQLGSAVSDRLCDYFFAENGLVAYRNNECIGKTSLLEYIGETKLQAFTNFVLGYLSKIELPFKRGTFVEFRNGMMNISPVGRNCNKDERDAFEQYDKEHKIRSKMIEAIKQRFPDLPFQYSIGGQISFDVFPHGWNKTYCLKYLSDYPDIHFFGDKTDEGGNDHELYVHIRVTGHRVSGPADLKPLIAKIEAQTEDT